MVLLRLDESWARPGKLMKATVFLFVAWPLLAWLLSFDLFSSVDADFLIPICVQFGIVCILIGGGDIIFLIYFHLDLGDISFLPFSWLIWCHLLDSSSFEFKTFICLIFHDIIFEPVVIEYWRLIIIVYALKQSFGACQNIYWENCF